MNNDVCRELFTKQGFGVDYKRIGKGLNYIVFGHHESGVLRQKATQEELNDLSDVQKKVSICN